MSEDLPGVGAGEWERQQARDAYERDRFTRRDRTGQLVGPDGTTLWIGGTDTTAGAEETDDPATLAATIRDPNYPNHTKESR